MEASLTDPRAKTITALGATHNLPVLANNLIASGATVAAAEAAFRDADEIRTIGAHMSRHGLQESFYMNLANQGTTLGNARKQMLNQLAVDGQKNIGGGDYPITNNFVTGDVADKRFGCMEAALLLRADPKFGSAQMLDHTGSPTNELMPGRGPALQARMEDAAREYRGTTLMQMARESLELRGINTRSMSRPEIAARALSPENGVIQTFGGGAESTSDFPSVLANVANKTLRQAYEAYPQTFKAFSRMVTAADFKPINRVQLSDAPALAQLNEKGEFQRANLKDSNQSYFLSTFGRIIAITRKAIINDDLQAFTRIPAILGVSAARMESDTVWAVITGNQVMGEDGNTLFHSAHNNLLTGGGSALSLNALGAARSKMRLQTAQQGTPLNLTPRFLVVPTVLETSALQLISPMQLAASAVTNVVPSWVMNLVPVVEPRLDANSQTAWYLVSDSAVIDTIEYAYLEGQGGVYIETRQGFEVDGIEIKAREDFAAAAIDFRGLQKNAGA